MTDLPSPTDRDEMDELPDDYDPNEVPDLWLELEFTGRVIVEQCSNVIEHTVRSDGRLVLTLDTTTVGILSFGGPVWYHGDLLEYLTDEHGLTVDGWKITVENDELGDEPIDPDPDDVDVSLDREQADMAKIQRKWVRQQLTTTLVLELTNPEL